MHAGYFGRQEDGAPLIDPEVEVVEVGDGVLVSVDVTTVVSVVVFGARGGITAVTLAGAGIGPPP
jgi:hypothetical protein